MIWCPEGVECHWSIAFVQVQLLVTSQDVDNYKQIKQDLDQLRSIVEKSELWVYKGQGPDEAMDGASGENEHKKTEVGDRKLGCRRRCVGPGNK